MKPVRILRVLEYEGDIEFIERSIKKRRVRGVVYINKCNRIRESIIGGVDNILDQITSTDKEVKL